MNTDYDPFKKHSKLIEHLMLRTYVKFSSKYTLSFNVGIFRNITQRSSRSVE